MKNYQKPQIDITDVTSREQISSLGEWLESSNGQEYQEAGITTYVLES